jgi:hypothetical protein
MPYASIDAEAKDALFQKNPLWLLTHDQIRGNLEPPPLDRPEYLSGESCTATSDTDTSPPVAGTCSFFKVYWGAAKRPIQQDSVQGCPSPQAQGWS